MFRDAEVKTSKSNSTYVLATLRVGQGSELVWWRVMAFGDEAREALLALGSGDSVAVSGALRAEIYKPVSGDPKLSLSVLADRVISAKPLKRGKAAARRSKTQVAPQADDPPRKPLPPCDGTVPW